MRPFRDNELRHVLDGKIANLNGKVDAFTNDEIMANALDLLADNLFEEFYILPVTIHDEEFAKRHIQQTKILRAIDPYFRNIYGQDYVEVDGYTMSFFFPYEGDRTLFTCRASTYSVSPYPEILLQDGFLVLKYERTVDEMKKDGAKDELDKAIARDIESLRRGIGYANKDVTQYNNGLHNLALKSLSDKKEKVEAFFAVASLFEVPVTKTTYSATHVPLKRNIAPIAHTYDRQSIYCISDKDYADILETIKHTGSTYERTPSSYKAMQEEDLRNTLLATLNATYKGDATGEAFRNHGKTDICIERENRAAFVAECKMWNGPKDVQPALEQLDSYLTWRDCKTALIFFVRRKDFMGILESVEQSLKNISFMRQVEAVDRNEFKCCMVSACNPGQIIHVRVMLFNMNA